MLTLKQSKKLHKQPNPVLVAFEKHLSPRCRDTITWNENHEGGFLVPTMPATHREEKLSHEEKAELVKFDAAFMEKIRNTPPELRLCSNM